ncbi:MAG: DNA polymerase III subunit beta [Eubacteriales bacterium]
MNFTTTKDDLLNAVNIVQKSISNKSTLPILEGMLLTVNQHEIILMGTDLEIGIKTEIPGEIRNSGSVVISAKLLSELVRKLPDDDIFFELKDNLVVNIKCSNSNFNIQGETGEDYPQLPEVNDENEITVNKNLFKSMIKETIFSVAKTESIPILTGELIEAQDGIIKFIALDGYRLALRQGKISEKIKLKEVIPERTLQEINRISSFVQEDEISLSYTQNQILFKIGKTYIISRLLEGDFINYNQIIPQNFTTKIKMYTKELLSSCERAALMVRDGKNNLIKMNFNDEYLEIQSNSEMGSVREEIAIEIEGEPLKIAFNSNYFIDVLKVIGDEEIILEFTTSVSPCLIKPVEGQNYIYLILPVRYIDHE